MTESENKCFVLTPTYAAVSYDHQPLISNKDLLNRSFLPTSIAISSARAKKHKSDRPLGRISTSLKIVAPVVVKPLMDSKSESVKIEVIPEK